MALEGVVTAGCSLILSSRFPDLSSLLHFHLPYRRIIRENEEQYQRERARREAELTQKLTRTTEGPAHHIVHVSGGECRVRVSDG